MNEHNLKDQQPPLSISEQIENLKEIGLVIEDESAAADFLNDVSYFRFIKAYSLGLKPRNGQYREGVSFNQLKELYLFNAKLRQLLFAQLERIEINLRCRLSNYFCNTYGVLSYYDSNYFVDPDHHAMFLTDIESEINKNRRAPFIRNFQENYRDHKIPFYALVEIIPFGKLSMFYKNMHSIDKKAIAGSFRVGYTYFESWIESLAYVRNLCAHYGRLYNAKFTKTPKLYPTDREKGITNNRLFGILICMKHMIGSTTSWSDFVVSIEKLFENHPHVQKQTMGFPDSWKNLLK